MRRFLPFLPDVHMAPFTALMVLVVFASLIVFWSGAFIFSDRRRHPSHFGRYSFAFIPMALCGHFANQLRYLPGVEGLSVQLAEQADGGMAVFGSFSIIWPLQLVLIIAGVVWSLFVVSRNYSRDREESMSREPRLVFYMLGLIGLYGAIFISMFVALGRMV
jgi:cytochrome c oxidase assembly factor CtaG